jgi:replicative DNA helicase
LKSKARKLRRAEGITLCEALDRVARAEGYPSWSLLVTRAGRQANDKLLDRVDPGDLVLVGARPGQGKTVWALKLLTEALHQRRPGGFFSLLNDPPNIDALLASVGERISTFSGTLVVDHSDEVCAQYIIETMRPCVTEKSVVVIDHLQLLDQRRRSPELQQQVNELDAFAKQTGAVLVIISQIHSSFDQQNKRLPTAENVRLPNVLDLSIFDKLMFLHGGRSRLHVGGE